MRDGIVFALRLSIRWFVGMWNRRNGVPIDWRGTRRRGGYAIQTRSTERLELLAKRADQKLLFVVGVIRHRRGLDEKTRRTSWLCHAPGRLGRGIEIVSDPLSPRVNVVFEILSGHFLQGRQDFDVAVRKRDH